MYLQYLLVTNPMLHIPLIFIWNVCAHAIPSSADTGQNLLRGRAGFASTPARLSVVNQHATVFLAQQIRERGVLRADLLSLTRDRPEALGRRTRYSKQAVRDRIDDRGYLCGERVPRVQFLWVCTDVEFAAPPKVAQPRRRVGWCTLHQRSRR